ncbi:hypothetical protein GCM10008922_07040 [Faecalicatena contorta]|uniref:hypothetical protein n=1 Tax=Faecalicatena contorta TaxID=39482 RepID=UPI0031DC2FE0
MAGKNKNRLIMWVLLAAAAMLAAGCSSQKEAPKLKEEPEPIERAVRIGCLESEEYYFYTDQLDSAADTMAKEGWLTGYSGEGENTEAVWDDICDSKSREGLEFVAGAVYNMTRMDKAALKELLRRQDLDLLLVFGTSAGAWITKNSDEISYDYMVFGSADPVTAGIAAGETKRLNSHAFVHIDSKRTGRQIDMAYRLFHFQDIGVVYEDSAAAYSYSGIRQLEERSSKYGFQIHTLHVSEPETAEDYQRYYSELKAAYAELIPDIDVLYITTGKIEDEKLPWLLEDVHKAGIITVAETQESQVKYGALVHITMSDPEEEGGFAGKTIMEYAAGTPIDELNQVYEITPKIVFNYDTAKLLNAEIPMSTYLIADAIYPGEAKR